MPGGKSRDLQQVVRKEKLGPEERSLLENRERAGRTREGAGRWLLCPAAAVRRAECVGKSSAGPKELC